MALAMSCYVWLPAPAQKSREMAPARDLSTLSAIVKELEMNYVDTIDSERAFKAAIDAMLGTIDPYTVYYPRQDRDELDQMTTGEYGGIGAYLHEKEDGTYISEPMVGSPSLEAGLRPGDKIIGVDTVNVDGKKTADITKLLRGIPDTKVTVRVRRPYVTDSLKSFTLKRAKLRNPSVPYYGIRDGRTGVIRISSFIESTGREVREALDSFRNHPEITGIVIDLRGNGGGLLEQAVDVASNFLPKGTEVVRTIGRDKANAKVYKTTRTPVYPDIPLAVLIDGGTASASEILAGAMQDLDRGILVGTRSFGKGLVQTTRQLPYSGTLKVTVARYYTPSGRLIQALDYTHRNEDGSAARVPDSLTHVYKTLHGRTIRDGGGLAPDSVVEYPDVNRLVYKVVVDNWAWDFANKFAAEHKSIDSPDKFVITDTIYNSFKESIDPKRFKFDTAMEEATDALRKIAGEEGYLNDETSAAFDTLKKLLTRDLNRDLDIHRKNIEDYLGAEIVERYYHNRGRIAYTYRNDSAYNRAVSLLNSPAYSALLGAPAKKRK